MTTDIATVIVSRATNTHCGIIEAYLPPVAPVPVVEAE